MKFAQHHPPLPEPQLDRLPALDPGLPVLTFLAVSGHGSAARNALEKALRPLYASPSALDDALSRLAGDGAIALSRTGRCRITDAGRRIAEAATGPLLGRSWIDLRTRLLPTLALGLDPRDKAVATYLARRENMESAALARLYDLQDAGDMPTRPSVRLALLRALLTARLPECGPAFTEITMHNSSRDAIGRAVMLGAAGLDRGAMRDAETALLHKALRLPPDAKGELGEALVRASLGKNTPRLPARIRVEAKAVREDLDAFAATARDLARTLQTEPFTGRVAIAQVYDAGIMRGLDFGSLEEFKSKVAGACRAGLLDLERYDIAGPMDNALRERSRTVFGRDERHFIVNEWI